MGRRKPESIIEGIAREAAKDTAREMKNRKVQSLERMRNTNAVLKARCKVLEKELTALDDTRQLLHALESNPLELHEIKAKEKSSRVNEATAVLVLSDLHFEEEVDPAEVNGLNEFNLKIATKRMDELAIGLVWLLAMVRAKGKHTGYKITTLYLPCLGDVITNYLRNENMQSNFLTPFEAIIFAGDLITQFVRTVLARCPWIEEVYMPMIPGNHDRLSFSRSTPFTKRIGMSFLPVLANMVSTALKDEKRVKIEESKSEHHYATIYDHTIRGIHGDRFTYQGGIGGIFVPARRHIAGLNKAKHAHLTMFGHWHTSKEDDLWISNGSLIGVNTYSIARGLDPEQPSQTFLLLDKLRGKRLCTPIHVGEKQEW